jgi:chemotaxis family two-component system response regulator Rcp1
MIAQRVIHILLVEDDAGDAELTRTALDESTLSMSLTVADDGEKAIACLRKQPPYANAITPDLVILDLNLPRKDGREVLAEIKSDPALRSIPVIILTTSSADNDIARAYAHGANCYITKPMGFPEFTKAIRAILDFWLGTARLPPREPR